jgi:hypothetical protein
MGVARGGISVRKEKEVKTKEEKCEEMRGEPCQIAT